uniref:Uncharacterized protein n=1 Tax=Laticauda laticaudata TaxID=8630 RepID=A0A8C5RZV8_LATLA
MPLLAEGIRIHGKKLTEQLKPLHDRLTSCFKELREKVEKLYGVITLPSSLTERKQSRSGSVVLPYIMSSTLRRLSVTSVTSSVGSTSSTSSDSVSSRPGSDGSILEPLMEKRSSAASRMEEQPAKDDADTRANKFRRKDWSLSKSQVIAEKDPEPRWMGKAPRPKSLQLGESKLTLFQNSSLQQAGALSPPPITPKTPRTQSMLIQLSPNWWRYLPEIPANLEFHNTFFFEILPSSHLSFHPSPPTCDCMTVALLLVSL